MGSRILRVEDIAAAAFEQRKSRSEGLLRRFTYFIENSYWDECCLEYVEEVESIALPIAVASALFVVFVGVMILG